MASSDEEDTNRGNVLIIVVWSLAGVAGIILAIGLYAKICLLRRVRASDYLAIIAFACAIVSNALLTVSYKWGLGRHIRYLNNTEQIQAIKFNFLCQPWGGISAMFGRVSICLLLLNFVVSSRLQKWILWFLIISQTTSSVVTTILVHAQCGTQLSAIWNPAVGAHCWDRLVIVNAGYVQSSLNSFADLALTLLPAMMLWRIKVEFAKKAAVIILLSLSIVALTASIIKAYLFKALGSRNDFTWEFVTLQLWASTECYLVIICAATPALKILIRGESPSNTGQQSYELNTSGRLSGLVATVNQKRSTASHRNQPVADTVSKRYPPSTSSQENILPPSDHWIVKKTDVTILYQTEESA